MSKPKKLQPKDKQKASKKKKIIIISIIVVVILAAGGFAGWWFFLRPKDAETPAEEAPKKDDGPHYYSKLTGLEIKSEAENDLPTFCLQMPNGADGARPQIGLTEAGIVFEAIAEAGITRFATVFQNPESSAIGPIRSLRTYYLDWDTPFDCSIVHAGGSTDATAALASGGYKDLNESYVYMWRDNSAYWAPNNLMTSASLLNKFAADEGIKSSNLQAFPRLLPKEAAEAKDAAITAANPADENASPTPLVSEITVNFGTVDTFNTVYKYNSETNTYRRSYASGEEHLVYECKNDLTEPKPKSDCGTAVQVAPSAVAVMMVDERLDSDNYHHVIQTIGTGKAYVFENGTAKVGTWKKTSKSAQIEFTDEQGNTISFTPGQLWIAAVPNYGGGVKY